MNLRVGNGVDFHKFAPEIGDLHIMLGGIKIPHKQKLLAHSDGDVILHSMCDAIFGAIASGNIGSHFPPSDSNWKDAESKIFLEYAYQLLKKAGGEIVNFDFTVMGENPKIMPHAIAIRENISKILGLETSRISIKAVTTEAMGFLGRGEGIGCLATGLFILK